MADSEVVQVGRGGAGNFYTKKHVENSQVTRNEDLEAQPSAQDTEPPNQDDNDNTVKYIPLGRGGAGNFYAPSSIEPPALDTNELTKVSAAESAGASSKTASMRGRGGVGNWFETASAREKREAEEERKRRDEEMRLERMVRENIESILTKPEATYGCGSERGVRVGKSRFGVTMGDQIGL